MSETAGWRRFLRLTFAKHHAVEQVDDELRFHIESLVERGINEGMSEQEARRAAMERFQSYPETRSALARRLERRAIVPAWRLVVDGLRQDLRITCRACFKRPAFAAVAALTLGLGVGACATLFSVVNSVLLKPLPYPDSERLVYIGSSRHGRPPSAFSTPEFLALRATTQTLESYAAYRHNPLTVRVGQEPIQYTAAAVTEDYFEVYGISPQLGRRFLPEDYGESPEPVVIVSFRFWRQELGSDPGVLGRVLTVAGRSTPQSSATIIGVMPSRFDAEVDLWLPEQLEGTWWEAENMFSNWTHSSVGRIAAGRRLEDVKAEVAALAASLAAAYPQYYSGRYNEGRSIGAMSLLDRTVVSYRSSILLLFGAAALLLAIAVSNVTGLLLARVLDRSQEIAVRSALGAGRGRIVRQFVTEALVLSLLGSFLGIVFAAGGVHVFRLLAPLGFPRTDTVSLNIGVVIFAIAVAVLSGLVCGWLPVVLSDRGSFPSTLHRGTRVGELKGNTRFRGLIVGFQVTVATCLLVGAGLLGNNFWRLNNVDPGIEGRGLLVVPVQVPGRYEAFEEYTGFLHETTRRIGAAPGVASVSWTPDPPMYGGWWYPEVVVEGTPEADPPNIRTHPVGPDYFRTMGVPILEGRGIGGADVAGSQPIAVVDEIMAGRFWPSEDPLGKQLRFEPSEPDSPWHTIVGVVGSTHIGSLAEEPTPQIYVPALQRTQTYGQSRIVIRSTIPPEALAPTVRAAIWAVDPDVPAPAVEMMEDRVAADLHDPRFHSVLLGTFSLCAVILTAAGIYGLMTYLVTGRTREIGIRTALGARPRHVVWTVSRQCLAIISLGLTAGLGVAVATSRVLGALLFAVSPVDLPTFGFMASALGSLALLTCAVPALRATRVDPSVALRWE